MEASHNGLRHLLVVGLGSIGQRHVRHFRRLGVECIDAYRTGKGTLAVANASAPDREFDDLEKALDARPDAVLVTNPTSLHLGVVRQALMRGVHVLVEKPLSHTLDGCDAVLDDAQANGGMLAVGYNMRFHPFLQMLKTIIHREVLGRPLLARAHFGAWLPGWHPWEDYRQSYAGREDLGGGVALTSSHEIDYLLWLFGASTFSAGTSSPTRTLGTNVEETVVGILRHPEGTVSTCSLSFAERPGHREILVTFEEGHVHLDFTERIFEVVNTAGEVVHHEKAGVAVSDSTYERQAAAFVHAIKTGHMGDLCTGKEAVAALAIAQNWKGE